MLKILIKNGSSCSSIQILAIFLIIQIKEEQKEIIKKKLKNIVHGCDVRMYILIIYQLNKKLWIRAMKFISQLIKNA